MRFYIGRLKAGDYQLGTIKAFFDPERGFAPDAHAISIFTHNGIRILKASGLKLAPGEIRKVKKIVIEVE